MKMKRLLSGLVCAVLLLGLAAPAYAADAPVDEAEAAQVLAALDVMTGDENGDLHLDDGVTRAEFTKLTIAASAYQDSVGPTASVSPYPDVPKTHWAAPYVQIAKEKGLVMGNLSGYFEPGRSITLAEGVTMALRLLGYTDADFSGAWPSGQMALYRTLKLDKGVTAGQDSPMARRDALYLFYNLLTAKMKDGKTVYLASLGHALTATGEIDRVALINSAMEGPVVAEGRWQDKVPFPVDDATIYRGGAMSTLSAIQELDVVYYSKPMRTLWAWSTKATGTLQAVAPSAAAPTSVTVSNKAYSIETPAAAFDLSDLGAWKVGDNVTLLLGRTGAVAAVRDASAVSQTVYGVVSSVENAAYTDKDGKNYTESTLTLTTTDATAFSCPYEQDKDKKLEAGDLVRVAIGAGGYQVEKLTQLNLTGKVSSDGTKVGEYSFADDVEILDTYGDTMAMKVYPSRLAGVSLKDKMVKFYALDEQGEISHMILDDVTGDIHQYGVVTEAKEHSYGMLVSSSYTYDVGGVAVPFVSQTSVWNVKKGPAVIRMDGKTVDRIVNLTGTELSAVDGTTAEAGNRKYAVSENVAVYEWKGGEKDKDKSYYYTDLDRVTGGDYKLTGYYDKAGSAGGCIRVIIAQPK